MRLLKSRSAMHRLPATPDVACPLDELHQRWIQRPASLQQRVRVQRLVHAILDRRVAAGKFVEERFPFGDERLHADAIDAYTLCHRGSQLARETQQFAQAVVRYPQPLELGRSEDAWPTPQG